MQSENKMFDDFVKMVNGFAGTFAGMGREASLNPLAKWGRSQPPKPVPLARLGMIARKNRAAIPAPHRPSRQNIPEADQSPLGNGDPTNTGQP